MYPHSIMDLKWGGIVFGMALGAYVGAFILANRITELEDSLSITQDVLKAVALQAGILIVDGTSV